ncbi:MAG: GSU2403 family nucleotidyltransferase fold protein [Candidatus Aquicultor sp.]
MSDELRPVLIKILWSLRDYLPDIVIVGGWAPYLYFQYLFPQQGITPLRTYDLDIVVANEVPIKSNATIDGILRSIGLNAQFTSSYSPPVMKYDGRLNGQEIELEFLTSQRGRSRAIAVTVQTGLSAQALRFADILYENTNSITISGVLDNGDFIELDIKVPSPAAYVFNKGLVFARSERSNKRSKDLYYIFDIISIDFPVYGKQIANQVIDLSGNYHKKWFRTFKQNLTAYFIDSTRGIDLVLSQRPSWAFTGMDDEQLRHYIDAVFKEFINRL